MAPKKELNNHQISARLTYNQNTPSFLQKFQNRVAGIPDDEDEYDQEFEDDGSGRPPIPKRPPIPERPADNPGSADEDDDGDDERPQVVVLKEGKHLTGLEAENERRIAKGLPPIQKPAEVASKDPIDERSSGKDPQPSAMKEKVDRSGLSFSSSKSGLKSGKRKAAGNLGEDAEESQASPTTKPPKKKPKKAEKKLLSFGDDDA